MAAGARIGKWDVLCALAWSVAVNTTKTRRKVRMDSINQPALRGNPSKSLLVPPLPAEKPVLNVCTTEVAVKDLSAAICTKAAGEVGSIPRNLPCVGHMHVFCTARSIAPIKRRQKLPRTPELTL